MVKEKSKFTLNIKVVMIILFIIITLLTFSGCASTNKTSSASITNITYTYNSETDETKIVFTQNYTNTSIYNMLKEKFTFNVYKDEVFLREEVWSWSTLVKASSDLSLRTYITVSGEIDSMELNSWTAEYDNLWNTYKVWWLIAIIAPVVISIVYLIVILAMDLDLADIFESVGTYISTAVILIISFIPSIIESNWFPIIITLVGVVELFILCLGMSGVRAILETLGKNPFENISDTIAQKKDLRAYKKFLEPIEKCGQDKEKLNEFEKAYLIQYCDEMDIAVSGRKKSDLIDAISAFAGGDKSVLKKSKPKSKKDSTQTEKKEKISNITFDDIAGLDEAKQSFKQKVVLPFEHPELFEKYGKKIGGGILLYGLPGTGKSMFAEAASNEVDALFIPVKCSDIKSKWYGESEKSIKEIFNKARKSKKAIIFFDEFEAIGAKRTDNSENGNNDLVPEILAEMQGVGTSKDNSTIIVIAATNKPWSIDSAFLRPGRFDDKIYIPLPDKEARKRLFELKLKNIPTNNLDYDVLVDLTEDFNGADITEFCEKLKLQAINKSIEENAEHIIDMNDVYAVSKNIKPSVTIEDIELLKEFEKQY